MSASIRVLIVHNLLWSHYKAAVFTELHRLAERRQTVRLLVVQLAKTERSRLGLGDPSPGEHAYPHVLLHDGPVEEFGLLARLRTLFGVVREFRPTVVNLTGYYDPAQLALLTYCKLRGIRTVLSNESTAADHARRGYRERLKRWIVRQFDGFFCFGTPSVRYLLALGAQPGQILSRRAAVVSDAVLRRAYESAPGSAPAERAQRGFLPRNVVYVGRLSREKNLLRLVRAFASARKQAQRGSDWGLLLRGEGPQRGELQSLVRQLGLSTVGSEAVNPDSPSSDAVQILPGVAWHEVPATLALGDVFVLPSQSEPWGLVVNEAMVCGLPVLVSERCGCAEDLVREGENGFTFPPDDEARLGQLLLRLMDAPASTRRAMGDASRRLVEAFSLPVVAEEMLTGFERMAAL